MSDDVVASSDEECTADEMREVAEFLGVPWDVSATKGDGTLWWEKPPAGSGGTSNAAVTTAEDGTLLYYDGDECTVVGMADDSPALVFLRARKAAAAATSRVADDDDPGLSPTGLHGPACACGHGPRRHEHTATRGPSGVQRGACVECACAGYDPGA